MKNTYEQLKNWSYLNSANLRILEGFVPKTLLSFNLLLKSNTWMIFFFVRQVEEERYKFNPDCKTWLILNSLFNWPQLAANDTEVEEVYSTFFKVSKDLISKGIEGAAEELCRTERNYVKHFLSLIKELPSRVKVGSQVKTFLDNLKVDLIIEFHEEFGESLQAAGDDICSGQFWQAR